MSRQIGMILQCVSKPPKQNEILELKKEMLKSYKNFLKDESYIGEEDRLLNIFELS